MSFTIKKGRNLTSIKAVLYGQEGVGKTTFASQWPDPLFIDTEGSTDTMDVARLDSPQSMEELMLMLMWIEQEKPCKTLVIDSIDWLEQYGLIEPDPLKELMINELKEKDCSTKQSN